LKPLNDQKRIISEAIPDITQDKKWKIANMEEKKKVE